MKLNRMVKKGIASSILLLLLSGCSSTNSLYIKSLEKKDNISFKFLKDVNSWIEIDKTSKNYTDWKNENFNKDNMVSVEKIDKCITKRKSITSTLESSKRHINRKVGLKTLSQCLPNERWNNEYIVSMFNHNNIYGYLAVRYDGIKHWSNSWLEDYIWYKVGIIENGNKVELFSNYKYRWGTHQGASDWQSKSFINKVLTYEISFLKKLKKSLDKYNVNYKIIKQTNNYNIYVLNNVIK